MRPPFHDDAIDALRSLATILDLANGLAADKSLLTALFSLELALDAGLSAEAARAAFYCGLLRQLGCTAFSEEQSLLGDDIALRRAMQSGDDTSAWHVMRAVVSASSTWSGRVSGLGRLLASSSRIRDEWFASTCDAARLLADSLAMGPLVAQGLEEMHERWDGQGGPRGLAGEQISEVARVALAAHTAVLFSMTSGEVAAREFIRTQLGAALDPRLGERTLRLAGSILSVSPQRIVNAEALLMENPLGVDARQIATAFGDFTDLQTSFTLGHSRRVASTAAAAAKMLGLNEVEQDCLFMAGTLHDLGQVAIDTATWLRPEWSPLERATAQRHVLLSASLLGNTPMFADIGGLVARHHERLDGSGYPDRLTSAKLSLTDRVLAAADTWVGLTQSRPHRPAHEVSASKRLLCDEVAQGRLDDKCVAVIVGSGGPRAKTQRLNAPALTSREMDVLQALAHGATNKEIASQLGISPRTVQHHAVHVYEKLGVRSRAGACLAAVRNGLLTSLTEPPPEKQDAQ